MRRLQWHLSSGTDEYAAPLNTPGLIDGTPDSNDATFGIKPLNVIRDVTGLLEGSVAVVEAACP